MQTNENQNMYRWRAFFAMVFAAGLNACATRGVVRPEGSANAYLSPGRVNVEVKKIRGEKDTHSLAVASELEKQLESGLVGKGFRMDESPPMLSVDVGVAVDVFDVTGNYYTLNGRAKAQVVGEYAPDRPLIGSETVSVEVPRILGKDAAERNLAEKLSSQLVDVVSESLRKGVTRLEVVRVQLSFVKFFGPDQSSYPELFVREVGDIPGVIHCELIQNNLQDKQAEFEVVYLADAFPQGFLTVLSGKRSLKIKPSVSR